MSIFDTLLGILPKKAATPSDLGLGSGGLSLLNKSPAPVPTTVSKISGEGSTLKTGTTPAPAPTKTLNYLQMGTQPKVAPKPTQPLTSASGKGLKLLQQMPPSTAKIELEAKDTLGGIVRPDIAETQNPYAIAQAAAAEGRKILHGEYRTPSESGLPSWVHEPVSKAMQVQSAGASYVGDTLQGGLRLLGVKGKLVDAVTPQQKLDRIYQYLDKHDPDAAMQLRTEQATSDYSPVAQGAGQALGMFAQGGMVSAAAGSMLSAVPAFNALNAGSHGIKGIHAAIGIQNAISGVANQVVHGGTRGYTAEQIARSIASSPSIIFAHTSIPALGIGALTDYFVGNAMGMNKTQAFLNAALNLGGNTMGYVGGQKAIADYELDMAKMRNSYHMSDQFEALPSKLKQEVFDSAQRAYAYTKGNPMDFDGNNKIYVSEMKRLAPLFKEYMQASPTGEARLIGLGGPTQSEGPGSLPSPKPSGGGDNTPESVFKNPAAIPEPKLVPPDARVLQHHQLSDGSQMPNKDGWVYRAMPRDQFNKIVESGQVTPSNPEPGQSFGRVYVDTDEQGAKMLSSIYGADDVVVRFKADSMPELHPDPHAPTMNMSAYATEPFAAGQAGMQVKLPQGYVKYEGPQMAAVFGAHPPAPVNVPPAAGVVPKGVIPVVPTTPAPTQQSDIFGGSATQQDISNRQVKESQALDLKQLLAEKSQAIPGGSVEEGQQSIPVEGEQQNFLGQITAGQAQPQPTVAPQSLPTRLTPSEARPIALDLYNQFLNESGDAAVSRADLGESYAAAEGNVGVLMQIIRDPVLRGAMQRLTGKAGYSALEGIEIEEVGSLLKKLRDLGNPGSDLVERVNKLERQVADGADSDHGQRMLESAIARARGEETKMRAVPRNVDLIEAIDTAVRTGRMQGTDEVAPGVTVDQLHEVLYNEVARKADAAAAKIKAPAVQPKGTPLLGDMLQREFVGSLKKQTLTKQQLEDARLEDSLSNKELSKLAMKEANFESDLEASRKMTQIEFNNTVAEAKLLPPEVANKIIADLNKLKAEGKIATPLEARLQKNKFLERRLSQEKGKTRAAQREAVTARREANHREMMHQYSTAHNMPADIQVQMKAIHQLYRKSMPITQSNALLAEMKGLVEVGAQQNRVWIAKKEYEAKKGLAAMQVAKKNQTDVKKKQLMQVFKNFNVEHTPTDLVMRFMDDSVHETLKDPIDAGYAEVALPLKKKWHDAIDTQLKTLGLNEKNLERINIYGLWNQEGKSGELGKARLINDKIVDPKVGPPTLDENESKMYRFLRDMFDSEMFPLVKKVSQDLEPKHIFAKRGGYWPNRFIGNNAEVRSTDRIIGPGNVAHGFTKEVTGNENMSPEVGSNLIFDHIRAVSNYVGMAQPIDKAGRILRYKDANNTQQSVAILGNENVKWLQNQWLELTMTGGQTPGEASAFSEILNYAGKLVYDGTLPARITTGGKQFLSTLEGALRASTKHGPVAGIKILIETIKNSPASFGEKMSSAIMDEMEKNLEMAEQVGVLEVVQEEMQTSKGVLKTPMDRVPRLKKFLNAFIRNPDMAARLSMARSLRETYMTKYNMDEATAMRRANEETRTLFGSTQAKDRPTTLGKKENRPWYLFGITDLFRGGVYRDAMAQVTRAAAQTLEGKIPPSEFFKIFGKSSIIMAGLLITSFMGDYMSTLNIEDDQTRAKAQKELFTFTYLLTLIATSPIPIFGSSARRAFNTGQALAAVPVIGPFSGVLTALHGALVAKTAETRNKNLATAGFKAGSMVGIPADPLRADWNLLKNTFGDMLGSTPDNGGLPPLPPLPKLPALPALPSLPSLSR